MSNPNIIYLLGAGASAQNRKNPNLENNDIPWMPLANQFPKAISNLNHQNSLINQLKRSINETQVHDLYAKVKNLGDMVEYHNTIDEAMRILDLNGNVPSFKEHKIAISLFFYFIEVIKNYRDTRYSQFLLAHIDKEFKFRQNIYFLSWNYDNQFELASNALMNGGINTVSLNDNNYHKINGSAYLKKINDSIQHDIDNILLDSESISFAWEDEVNSKMNEKLDSFLNKPQFIGADNIIVSIGYSFPPVNHSFDYQILKTLKPRKVYIQNLENIASSLEERFGGIFVSTLLGKLPDRFYHVGDCSRFYIPNEYFESSR